MTHLERELSKQMNIKRKIGETLSLNDEDGKEVVYQVVSNEAFAVRVIQEASTCKYLYDLDGVVLYVTHYGIIPEKLDICLGITKSAMKELGWEIKEDAAAGNAPFDADGKLRSSRELNDKNLSMKARKVASAFATLADALLLLEKYEDKCMSNRRNKNEEKS